MTQGEGAIVPVTRAGALAGACPVCRVPLAGETWTCPCCETGLHRDCHAEIGGCARYACVEAATPRRRLEQYLRSQLQLAEKSAQSCALLMVASLSVVGLGIALGGAYANEPLVILVLLLLPLQALVPALRQARLAGQKLRLLARAPALPELRPLLIEMRDDTGAAAPARMLAHARKSARTKAWLGFALLAAAAALPAAGLLGGLQALIFAVAFLASSALSARAASAGLEAQRMHTVWLEELEEHQLAPEERALAAVALGEKPDADEARAMAKKA